MKEELRENLREICRRFGDEPPKTLNGLRERFDAVADCYGADWDLDEANRLEVAPVVRRWAGRILEIGCGNGRMIGKFIDPGRHTVFGGDLSLRMLQCAKKRLETVEGDVFLIHSDGDALPFKNESFDGVVCVNTIHSIPDRGVALGILREAARVLKPSGHFLLEFRNSLNPERRRIRRRKVLFAPQETYSYFEIKRLAKNLGLRVEKAMPLSSKSYTLHRGPRAYVFFRRMLSSVNYRLRQWHLYSPCVGAVMRKRPECTWKAIGK